LKSVGPNATLVQNDVGTVLRDLKARLVGEIDVAGPDLARSLTDLGLVDEYRLYFRPFVLGHGTPFFAGPRPPLRLVASDLVGEGVIRLTYAHAQSRLTRPALVAAVPKTTGPNQELGLPHHLGNSPVQLRIIINTGRFQQLLDFRH
jgi:RibD C-terminal domain